MLPVTHPQEKDISVRKIDTQAYISALRGLVREGKEVNVTVSGSSMAPFLIHHRDSVSMKAPDRPLRTGDVVFYQRDSGQYVMHRIIRVHETADGLRYDIAGDGQTEIESGIRPDQIFAYIFSVKRKGRKNAPGSFWWEFFEKVWPRIIPFRRTVIRAYGLLARVRPGSR